MHQMRSLPDDFEPRANTNELPTNNNTTTVPPYFSSSELTTLPNYLEGFQLLKHYTFRSDFDRDFYKVMMHGDLKLKEELKKALFRTFALRLLLILPLIFAVLFTVLYVYRESNYYFAYSATVFLFFGFITISQLYFFIHYLRSIRSKEDYIRLNRDIAARLEEVERRRYNRETELVTYTLPPPTYREAANSPPAYG